MGESKRKTPRSRPFYGWYIVGAVFVSSMVTGGAAMSAFSVFLPVMRDSLGWSVTTLTGAYSLRSLVSAVSVLALGPLVDRYGPRGLMLVGALILGLALVSVSRVQAVWQFYLLFGVLASLGMSSSGGLVTSAAVAKWFMRKRGRAIAFGMAGGSMGLGLFSPLTHGLISWLDWRDAWLLLGLISVAVIVPCALVMRRRPEDMGLHPDGAPPITTVGAQSVTEEESWTLREALKTPSAWILAGAVSVGMLAHMSFILHQFSFFTLRGVPLGLSALAITFNMGGSILSKVFWGFMVERIPVRYCLMGTFIGRGIAVLLLLVVPTSVFTVYLFSFMYGLAGGAFSSLQPVAWANYYGRRFVGTIRGAFLPLDHGAAALGPLFAAYIFDTTGSYNVAFVIFVALFATAAISITLARPPQRRAKGVLAPRPAVSATDVEGS